MKKAIAFTVLAATATLASAQEQARVLSATPIVQQVAIPRQVCTNETVYTGQRTTGGGAVLGAIAGGAAGNAVGKGSGRAAATAIGVIGGAVLGNQIEGNGQPRYQNVQRCTTETYYENRTVGYDVVYEYAGRQYTTQMAQPPGAQIPLQVTPLGSTPYGASGGNPPLGQPQPYAGSGYASSGVVTAPPNAFGAPPAYAPYAPAWPPYPEPASSWGMGPAKPFGQDLYR